MNQFMVNDFVITSKSLLINDEIVSTAAMRANDQHRKPTMGVDVSRNNQVWNEELVLNEYNEKQSSIICESRPSRRVRRPDSTRGHQEQASYTQNKSDVSKNKIVIRS